MRKSTLLSCAAILSLLFTFTSCEDLDELADLGLRPHILAPVLKTEIDIYDFEKLLTQTTDYEISMGNIPFPTGVNIPVFPGFGPSPELPAEYLNIFDIANEIVLEELIATISFNNTFPTAILEGTTIILKDSTNGNEILTHVLPVGTKVQPGETYSIPVNKEDISISSTIAISMDKLTLDQGTNVTFSNEDFVVIVDVELIDLDYVNLKNNVSYEDIAIQAFDLNISDAADTSAYSGSLSIFLTNKYPAGFNLKMDLLDENNQTVFKIFGDSSLYVEHAPLDANGNVIGETIAEKIDFISVEDISNLNTVKNMRIEVVLNTPSAPNQLILSEITTIDMLVTADIKIDPSKTE